MIVQCILSNNCIYCCWAISDSKGEVKSYSIWLKYGRVKKTTDKQNSAGFIEMVSLMC